MGIRETEEQRKAEMFGPKMRQAEATIASTEAGTEASLVTTDKVQQDIDMRTLAAKQEAEASMAAVNMLKEKYNIDITSPAQLEKVVAAMTGVEEVERIQAGRVAEMPEKRVEAEAIETDVKIEKGGAQLGFGKERKDVVSAELEAGAEMPQAELKIKKSQAAENKANRDYINQKVVELKKIVEIADFRKQIEYDLTQSDIDLNKAQAGLASKKTEEVEAAKMSVNAGRIVIRDRLKAEFLAKGMTEEVATNEATLMASRLLSPEILYRMIDGAIDAKQLANTDERSGLTAARKTLVSLGRVPKEEKIDKTVIWAEIDELIAELTGQLNLWGIEYSEARRAELMREKGLTTEQVEQEAEFFRTP